uniref:Synaptotagmin n=1 Tax=Oncorhynchus mykiss TaxID=8022 RepID=A0A8C7SFY4_ONCMY
MRLWNLFKNKPEAMVGPEPTGTGATMTAAPAVAIATTVAEPPGNGTESKNDMFEEIKSKFLNEIDKIPRKSSLFFPPPLTHIHVLCMV